MQSLHRLTSHWEHPLNNSRVTPCRFCALFTPPLLRHGTWPAMFHHMLYIEFSFPLPRHRKVSNQLMGQFHSKLQLSPSPNPVVFGPQAMIWGLVHQYVLIYNTYIVQEQVLPPLQAFPCDVVCGPKLNSMVVHHSSRHYKV